MSSFCECFVVVNFAVVDLGGTRRAVYKMAKISHKGTIPSRRECEVLLKCCALLVVAPRKNPSRHWF